MRRTDTQTWKRFGALIRRLRKEKRLGLREMSKQAMIHIEGRGLSPSYLSQIERGLTAPPRRPVLEVLAEVLDVPVEKLELTTQGWIVLDLVQTLEPFPEYAELVKQIKQGKPLGSDLSQALMDAYKRYPAKGRNKQARFTFMEDGTFSFLFFYRPREG